MSRKINDGLNWHERQKRQRAEARKTSYYTVFRAGRRITDFSYPEEKAREVFADLLASNPENRLEPVDKPTVGHALRDTNVMFGARKPKLKATV